MRPAKIAMLIAGALLGLAAFGLLAGGAFLTWAHSTQRDSAGYYSTGTHVFDSDAYAITSEHVDIFSGRDDWTPTDTFGAARIEAERTDGGQVFVGIGRQADVDAYLRASAHDELRSIDLDPFRAAYRRVDGEAGPGRPDEQAFWVASAVGAERQSVTWNAENGEWAVVVMNADGARGVSVDASGGLKTGILLPIGLGLLAAALVAGAAAVALVVAGLREERGPTAPAGASGVTAAPVRLDARLDAPLHRALWLVKWFLAIPHLVVLVFLWIAFVLLTIVAGFAILFTGRYPRSIFGFNVGVMRWTWRVTVYAFTFMTDRYPPFQLGPDPSYPAELSIDYPAHLSQSLVLVKWWLLALPHLLIIAVLTGGAGSGGGLAFLLAVIAAVGLAFTGTYPAGLFDFVTGMERWRYRVLAYVALMTDEYPPFRLDMGGTDPGSAPRPPVGPPDRNAELVQV